MNSQIAVRPRFRTAWWPDRFCCLRRAGVFLLTVLLLGLWWSWQPASGDATAALSINQLVRWQDASHDWLLVVDPATHELVVYDAVDGRPLGRLGSDDGLPQVRSIALRGSRLYVTGSTQTQAHLLNLPELQAVTANAE